MDSFKSTGWTSRLMQYEKLRTHCAISVKRRDLSKNLSFYEQLPDSRVSILKLSIVFFSHLALIAGVHCSISVTGPTNSALSQFTPCSKFGIAWMALAGITSECICTCVLAGILQAFIPVCKNRTLFNTIHNVPCNILYRVGRGNSYDLITKGYFRDFRTWRHLNPVGVL